MMKNAFYFILTALFVLKIFKFFYNQLYVEDMSRKILKVKPNYFRRDPFISFRALGNLSHCQE